MTMLYRVTNLKAPPGYDAEVLRRIIAEMMNMPVAAISAPRVVKESIDARKKPKIIMVLQVEFTLTESPEQPLPKDVRAVGRSLLDIPLPDALQVLAPDRKPQHPVVVIGAGPAGLFAALALGEAGVPTLLLERGKPVETRMRDIGQLRSHGTLDPESNVCFGEGGAGAYTDGKLYTRVKHPYVRYVMRRFVDFEAPEDILVKAHPHLGTDKLVRIVKRMREHIVAQGVEVRFGARVENIMVRDGAVRGVVLADGEEIPAHRVILAIGHSARDTLAALLDAGVTVEPKPFAVGVRAEHPQAMINRNQFGNAERDPLLGAAAYSLTHQIDDPYLERRGVYSFCMCPGGFIVPSPTELDHMAVNGMSNAGRSSAYANSGVVVQVAPEDLARHGYEHHPLMGIAFQRDLEARVFKSTAMRYAAPAMRISDFVKNKASGNLAGTNFRPRIEPHDLWELLPAWIAEPLREGLLAFDRKIRGYAGNEGNLLAVESRTSAPIRIPREANLECASMPGLFPIGEGAGYAGGIVSAAVDGLKAAEHIITELR
ncbi:MAG: FAD-dependent oxidoreductase [Acidobacteriota bacterium]|nr:FAD-dependent oxidoreductase [Acidobacteriota bacterium]